MHLYLVYFRMWGNEDLVFVAAVYNSLEDAEKAIQEQYEYDRVENYDKSGEYKIVEVPYYPTYFNNYKDIPKKLK